MEGPLSVYPDDPRELPASRGELFRRETRAHALLEISEHVDSERRAEIAREILLLGAAAIAPLRRFAGSREENTAALARNVLRLLVPDEVGRQIYSGLKLEKHDYRIEHGAVLLSRLCYPNLPVQRVMTDIDELGKKAGDYVYEELGIPRKEAKKAAARQTVEVIKKLGEFWREEGFHGNAENYYSDKNSYLPDVIERRTGLPIALSVLYLALARRLYLSADGVGLPGHFIVRVRIPLKNEEHFVLIDPFNSARPMSIDDCKQRVEATGLPFVIEEHLKPAQPRDILTRMCHNLLALFDHQKKALDAERVATVLIHLQPRDPVPLLLRGERRLRRGDRRGARGDFSKARDIDTKGPVGRMADELIRRMGFENPFDV